MKKNSIFSLVKKFYFCNFEDMKTGTLKRGEEILDWGREYEVVRRGARVLQVVRGIIQNRINMIVETLIGVEEFTLEIKVATRSYQIPIKIDILNLDDRNYNRDNRGFLLYVEGYPEISNFVTGKRGDESVLQEWLTWFEWYLTHAIKVLQRGESLEQKFEVLAQFEQTPRREAAE